MRKAKMVTVLVNFILFIAMSSSTVSNPVFLAQSDPPNWVSSYTHHGGYLDEVWWRVYGSGQTAQTMLDLENGIIDAHTERIQDAYLNQLLLNPNVDVQIHLTNRYRVLTLNNARFPLNITGFRRAMAFGMDKYKINNDAIGGRGQPLDSYFSTVATEWEVESSLSTHFYGKDIASGNASLERNHFKDLDGDGWREYDMNKNGVWDAGYDLDDNDPAVVIDIWPSLNFQPAIVAANVARDGLAEMGIRSTVTEKDLTWILDQVMQGFYHVAIWTEGLPFVNPAKTLYDRFRFGTPGNSNFGTRFSNSTIDGILDQMMASKTAAEAKQYAKQANAMLAYEQPQIVCYNDVLIDAWRTDKFEFPLVFVAGGRTHVDNIYNPTQAHLKNLTYGGVLKLSNGGQMDTTNPWMQKSQYEANINQQIFEGLCDVDPYTWDPIPRLAYDWDIEDTTALGDIQDGEKYTFYLYPNVAWHDGKPVTAYDINFTLQEVIPQTVNDFAERKNIYKIEIPDSHTIAFYVNKSSYFDFIAIIDGIMYIVPQHIWEPNAGGDYSTFELGVGTTWIGSGPYRIQSRIPGQEIRLERNEKWHFAIDWEGGWPPNITTYTPPTPPPTTPPTTPPTSPTTGPTTPPSSTTTSTIPITSPSWGLLVIMVSVGTAYAFKKRHRKKVP
ncbi:MAG: ABC transporter substrate-binding protein [Candidatus Heimdallarchaeota archaeon]